MVVFTYAVDILTLHAVANTCLASIITMLCLLDSAAEGLDTRSSSLADVVCSSGVSPRYRSRLASGFFAPSLGTGLPQRLTMLVEVVHRGLSGIQVIVVRSNMPHATTNFGINHRRIGPYGL